jgi:hypothetical protein
MTLLEILVSADDPELAAANVSFHLGAGVRTVLVARAGLSDGVEAALEPWTSDGRAIVVDGDATALARAAATEHGGEWVIVAPAEEFWWPRGESLADPLAAMPERYGVVQGLVRTFLPNDGDGPFAERRIRRPVLTAATAPASPSAALRPLYRADPALVVADEPSRRLVPLRAWYPFEVLRFPRGDPSTEGGAELVADTRLRDALRALAAGEPLAFRVPDLVEDAAYAAECAAVGEVDLPRLEREIGDLERRVASLEQRLWPRVVRRVTRLARR